MEKLKLINHFLNHIGYKVDKYKPSNSFDLFLKRIITDKSINVVIDVGANIGQYAEIIFDLGFKGEIYSIEPLHEPYSILIKKSKKFDNWTILPRMAVGNYDGEIEINVSKNSFSSSVLDIREEHVKAAPESMFISQEKVVIKKLDSIFTKNMINDSSILLKIDVQGYEENVLYGAEFVINFIKIIQIELSLVPLYENQKLFKEMINLIESKGFRLYNIIPGFSDENTGEMLQFDGIFVRR